MTAPLDDYIPLPDARERFEILVDAPAEIVFAAAQEYDMQSHPIVRAIFRLREFLTRSTPTKRTPRGMLAELQGIGWGVLRAEPNRLFVAGARCQPWLGNVQFRAIPAPEFRGYAAPGEVKIAWTVELTPVDVAKTRLVTETRAVATDAEARRRFLRYWRWARFGIIPIRWLLLPAIGHRAEAEWRSRRLVR